MAASRKAEAKAASSREKYKTMLEEIGSIVKWARSPCSSPTDAASGKGRSVASRTCDDHCVCSMVEVQTQILYVMKRTKALARLDCRHECV